MHQQPKFTIGVFDYQITTEMMGAEVVVDALVEAGMPSEDVHVFVPPFLMHPPEGLSATLEDMGMDAATAHWCEERYQAGKVLIVVRTSEGHRMADEILLRNGALEINPGEVRSAT